MFKGLKSLVAGLLAGATLGILFAPKKGEEFRKEIKAEVEKGGSGLQSVKSNMLQMGKELGDTAKGTYEELKQSGKLEELEMQAKKVIGKVETSARRSVKKASRKAKTVVRKAKRAAGKVANKAEKNAKKIIRKLKS